MAYRALNQQLIISPSPYIPASMDLHHLQFKHPWRAYQARVLEHLHRYREDRRVHIVAPPGAGKTVLGLELVRRINRQALILAPSLTIRAQWAQRFREDFGAETKLISHRLDHPGPLTIVTYQALFEFHKRQGITDLEWVKVLVVDECHHLRNEWWKVLDKLVAQYSPELVALTATPPYDVSGIEWRRYNQFCGEIDEEISIPELVASGDLCPHQDYLYPVLPPPGERDIITEWQTRKANLLEAFHQRSSLAYFLQEHPWLSQPEAHYGEIFEQPEYFTALLSVLKAQGSEPPAATLGVLHGEATIAPTLDGYWAGIFLQRALRDDEYFASEEGKEQLRPLRRIVTGMGAWQQGKLYLADDLPPAHGKKSAALDNPGAKLSALIEIARLESEDLAAKLRMVILTDHIYAELLPTTEHDRTELTKMGTVPAFEALRRQTNTLYEGDLCLLTGSLIIIPRHAESRLLELAYEELPTERVIKTKPLFPDAPYLMVNTGGLANKYSVGWITQLFTEGIIRIIVGTKSLLGEGWDAPVINSLVLANTVGSFVLSNQMRGRAIRTVLNDPDKTANIWHPVVVHPEVHKGGPDVKRLARRFRAFAGPRLDGKPIIQNGLNRFGDAWLSQGEDAVKTFRNTTLKAATQRHGLTSAWQKALEGGDQLVEAIKPPAERYYAKKDPLTLHYKERINHHFEAGFRQVLLEIKRATFVASAAAAGVFLIQVESHTILPLAVLAIVGGWFFISKFRSMVARALAQGIIAQQPLAFKNELRLRPHLLIPAILGGLAFLFSLSAGIAFVSVFFCWLTGYLWLHPGRKMAAATRKHELLADDSERMERYGKALAHSLQQAGFFHQATAEQLRLEQDGDTLMLYLSDAEHHDTHLFAAALSELMSPVNNPRYLLRLDQPPDWARGEYYLAVPSAFGTRKLATNLAAHLSDTTDHTFLPVYTREPSGRLHLLTARLQASGHPEAVAERDMLWR